MRCPYCRNEVNPMEAMMDENWRAVLELRASFGIHHKLVWEYVEKFGVTPLNLKVSKLRRLLEEMSRLFESKKLTWKKCTYEVTEASIVEALRVTCNAELTLPLTDHNYFKRVVLGEVAKGLKTERTAQDKALRKREEEVGVRKGGEVKRRDEGRKGGREEVLTGEELRKRAGDFLKGM